MQEDIKVLIKIDERNLVTAIGSDVFVKDTNGWIVIDEGIGERFVHAQSNYLSNPLYDELGRSNYIYELENLRLLGESEKSELYPQEYSEPTFEEHMTDAYLDLDYRVSCIELGII